MKNTLKFLAVVAVMSAFLTACGGKTEQTSDAQDTTATEVAAPAADTTQTAAPADSVAQ